MQILAIGDVIGKPGRQAVQKLLPGLRRQYGLELVIAKQKVDLESPAFRLLARERDRWAREDHYRFPGPIQFNGPAADAKPISLQLNALG